jgi:outer membrane protein assembly factor BamB
LCYLQLVFLLPMPTNSLSAQKVEKQIVTFSECWRYPTSASSSVRSVVDGSNLYVAESASNVSAISLAGGERLWSTEIGGEIDSNLLVVGASVFVVTETPAKAAQQGTLRLKQLSAKTGIPVFEAEVPFGTGMERLEAAAEKVVGIGSSGLVSAFEPGRKTPVWQRKYGTANVNSLFVRGDMIGFATTDRKIRLLSLVDGSELATVETDGAASALDMIDGDLVWGDDRGNVVRYDLKKGSVYWKFKNGARISDIKATDDGVLAASFDNFVYLISPYFGSVRWKRRLAARVSSLTLGVDGLIAVQTVGESSVAILNIDNGKSLGQVKFAEGEELVQPAINVGGRFLFITNLAVTARSSVACLAK